MKKERAVVRRLLVRLVDLVNEKQSMRCTFQEITEVLLSVAAQAGERAGYECIEFSKTAHRFFHAAEDVNARSRNAKPPLVN